MNFDELKKLVRRVGSVVLFDGNKPELVVLPYDKAGLNLNGDNGGNDYEQREIERLNNEILALREELAQKEREVGGYEEETL